MTDKEIIIDGIDVSRCSNYDHGSYFECNVCCCHCDEVPNCYYKQLKRKEQECKELETMVAEAEEAPICFHCSEEPCIRQERDKYKKLSVVFKDVNKQLGYKYIILKQALDEIEELAKHNNFLVRDPFCGTGYRDLSGQILNTINKAKKENKDEHI